jgi:phosphoribosyl-ATP pyrophosphohydrolase
MTDSADVLHKLMEVVRKRRDIPSDESYTSQLFAGGIERIGGKVTEEAAEVVEAAGEPGEGGRTHLVREAADLIYHLLVLLAARNADLAEVEAELARRFGVSGLEEKASRGSRIGPQDNGTVGP